MGCKAIARADVERGGGPMWTSSEPAWSGTTTQRVGMERGGSTVGRRGEGRRFNAVGPTNSVDKHNSPPQCNFFVVSCVLVCVPIQCLA